MKFLPLILLLLSCSLLTPRLQAEEPTRQQTEEWIQNKLYAWVVSPFGNAPHGYEWADSSLAYKANREKVDSDWYEYRINFSVPQSRFSIDQTSHNNIDHFLIKIALTDHTYFFKGHDPRPGKITYVFSFKTLEQRDRVLKAMQHLVFLHTGESPQANNIF